MKKVLLITCFAFTSFCAYAQYKHLWTKQIGDNNNNYGPYSTIDSFGNTVLFFETFYDYDIDPDTSSTVLIGLLNRPNCFDHVVAKYDSSGNYLWHRVASFYNTSVFFNVKTDVTGNVFYTGYFSHTAIIEDGMGGYDTIVSSNAGNDMNIIIVKYSPTGTLLFANKIESSWAENQTLIIDDGGNFFVTGYAALGYIDFDPGPGQSIVNTSSFTAFFVKYNNAGQLLFYRVFTPQPLSQLLIADVKVDKSGNIVTTGWVDGTADLGGGNVGTGQFFAKYDSAGNYIFHKLITGDLNFINSLGVDRQNNIILSGFIRTTALDIDPGTGVYIVLPNGANEALLAKYDSLGNFIWGHGFGSASSDVCGKLAIDSSDNIYAYTSFGGIVIGNPSFGLPSALHTPSLIKFDSNGYIISFKSLINWGISDLKLLNHNELFIQGGFNFNADFDLTTGISIFSSFGGSDYFISKYLLKDEHYLISGKVYSDVNNDSIYNAGDVPMQNVVVQVNPGGYYASTNAAGDYYCYVEQGNYSVSVPALPAHYMTCYPAADTAIFMTGNTQVDTANNFALKPEPNALDLKITATNLGPARPGFVAGMVLSASNIGTVTTTPQVTADYSNNLIFYSSSPVADSIAPYYLQFDLDTLLPTHSKNILTEYLVTANLGDTVTSECHIYPDSADLNPTNNKDKLTLIAQGSWDPNYKDVAPQGALLPAQADTTLLTYTIHFQNTGTDTAFTVILVDTLSALLNIPTFTLEASSHAMSFVISEHGIVEFTFNNILLPDSGVDFIGSCGFVKYSIKPLVGLTNGMNIENTAHIVFDFNVPVTTNTTQTPIGVLGVGAVADKNSNIFLYPNPAHSSITLSHLNSTIPYSISVTDVLGNTVITQTAKGSERTAVNVAALAAGVYFVVVESDGVREVKKLVKQ